MNGTVFLLAGFFVFVVVAFVVALFAFPELMGISKSEKQNDDSKGSQ